MTAATTRADAAAALRNFGHRFLEHDVDDDLLNRIREVARDLTQAVVSSPRLRRSTEDLRSEIPEEPPLDGAAMDHHPGCPVSGKDNPLGLAARFCRDGDDVVARVTFDAGCSGMPGFAHGGPVAAVFDDVMGFVLSTMNGLSGYTATMTVSYRAPVRIGREVEYRGRLARRDGRKLYIESTAHDETGTLLADATGLFIEVPIESIAKTASS
ncbi:PaaI family thioesterase [Nocardia sp. NPDC059239]|uniref:PaaI family thioesterase n=1 Tax=unclassified Nocardia TaxID=2637762 RepID=UPI0036D06AAF